MTLRLPALITLYLIAWKCLLAADDLAVSQLRALADSGRSAEAELTVREYLKTNPASADAHYLLGYILFKRQNAKGSLAEFTEGAKYRKPAAYDLAVVGGDYVLLRDYPDADKWFTQSLSWDPDNFQTLYYLGRTKYNENRFDEAIAVFTRCLRIDPKNVKAQDNLGLSLQGLGKTEEAIAAYKTAIEWQAASSAKDFGPYLNLGSLLVEQDRPAEAVPHLLLALQIAPDDVKAHRELGKAYFHLNQFEKAQFQLEKSVQLAPESAPTHFVLAQVYRKRGLTEKARQEAERYTKLSGTHSASEDPR